MTCFQQVTQTVTSSDKTTDLLQVMITWLKKQKQKIERAVLTETLGIMIRIEVLDDKIILKDELVG